MPVYDCGDPGCSECRRAFGLDRSKAIANYKAREAYYATLPQPNIALALASSPGQQSTMDGEEG